MITTSTPAAAGGGGSSRNNAMTVPPSTTTGATDPSHAPRTSGPKESTEIFDAALIPTILPRILNIVDSLVEASQNASSLSAPPRGGGGGGGGGPEDAAASQDGEAGPSANMPNGAGSPQGPLPTAAAAVAVQERSEGPSIALGQVSDDDSSLHDFLFSSSVSGGGLLSGARSAEGPGRQPSELSLRILRQARELRDVYRAANRAIEAMEGGEWARDEQLTIIRRLEEMRESEQRAGESFDRAACAVLESSH